MRPLLSLALLCTVVVAVPADPPADKVKHLIAQLGSPDFHAREAATRELETVGPPALAALKAATASEDMEVARRAGELASRIARRADNDRTLAPTLVDLTFEDKPLSEVLAALGKQTGYKLMAPDVDDPTVKVTVKTNGKVPFWVAVQQVCDAAGLEVGPVTAIAVAAAPTPEPLVATFAPVKPVQLAIIPLRNIQIVPAPKLVPAKPADPPAALQKQAEVARDLAEVLKRRMEVAERVQPKVAEKQPGAEQKRLQELQAAQLAEAQRLLAALAEEQARQAVAARSGYTPTAPALPGMIVLRPKAKPYPACVSGAVRVEATPFPAAALPAVPTTLIPIVLTAAAEPKLKWEHVESVRVTKAIDDAGRTLVTAPADSSALTTRVHPVQGGAIVLEGGLGAVLVPTHGTVAASFSPQPTQAVVRLKADGPTKSLKELEGVIRAVVRAGPEEMAAATGFDDAAVTAFGPNGLGLKVSKLEPVPDKEDEFTLDVVVGYKAGEVQLADNSAPGVTETVGNGQVIVRQQMVIGGEVVLRQQVIGAGFRGGRRGGYRVAGENSGLSVFGLTVTDAAGTPFELTAPTSVRRFDADGGVTDEVKLVLKPTAKGQGKPVKVAFAGVRAKTVEVPFKLADVPVAAGTGPADEKKR